MLEERGYARVVHTPSRFLLRASFCAAVFVAVGSVAGCESGWESEIPTADVSMTPYEDLYRLLSTGTIFGGHVPSRVDVSETLATVSLVIGGSLVTAPISYADVGIDLTHHLGKDKWRVDLYKPDGKLLVRIESPSASHANDLAMTLATLQAITSDSP